MAEESEDYPLTELDLTKSDYALLDRIEATSWWDGTAGSLPRLVLTELECLEAPAEREIDELWALASQLPALFERFKVAREAAAGFSLNHSFLTPDERKILRKLRGCQSSEATEPAGLLGLDRAEVAQIFGFGVRSLSRLCALARRVALELYLRAEEDSGGSFRPGLLTPREYREIPLDEIEEILLGDLDRFLLAGTSREATIARSFWGFLREPENYQALGDRMKITRERVRQISRRNHQRLARSLSIDIDVLRKNILSHSTLELAREMPILAGHFRDQSRLPALLHRLFDSSPGEEPQPLLLLPWDRAVRIISDLFGRTPAPVSAERCLAELASDEPERCWAARMFDALRIEEHFEVREGIVHPHHLSRRIAVGHVLAEYPDGLHWSELVRTVNDRALCRPPIPDDAPNSTTLCTDLSYRCGHGRYRHRRFLAVPADQVGDLLSSVRAALQRSGARCANLRVLYQENREFLPVEYTELRLLLSTHGSEHELFFNGDGRWKADTVSLDPDPPMIDTEQALLEILADADAPVSLAVIIGKFVAIRARTIQATLSRLLQEGQVLNVGKSHYTTAAHAFAGFDLPAVIDAIEEILTTRGCPTEGGFLKESLDARFGWKQPRNWYLCAARNGAADRGWRVRWTQVSPGGGGSAGPRS